MLFVFIATLLEQMSTWVGNLKLIAKCFQSSQKISSTYCTSPLENNLFRLEYRNKYNKLLPVCTNSSNWINPVF